MDCYGLLDLHNDHAILFIPRLDNLYKIWMTVMTKEESAIKEQNRIMLEQERRANNPPPRASSRIATQNPRGGKM